MTKSNNNQNNLCPFLGLSDDTTSHMAFTSPENYCHQCKPITPIKLEYQNDYCLDTNFKNCSIYINGAGKRMPADLVYDARADRQPASSDQRFFWFGVVLVGIFIAISLYYIVDSIDRKRITNPVGANNVQSPTVIVNSASISSTETPEAIVLPSLSPEPSTSLPLFTATITPFPTLTSTVPTPKSSITSTVTQMVIKTTTATISATFTLTPTLTQIPPHSLEIPIGNEKLYLIHKIVDGENLSTLAETYQTSFEAIQAVNFTLIIPIRIDAIVVIPLKQENPQGLPKLEPYQILQDQTTPEALAEKLKIDLVLFNSLNGFEDGEKLNKGNWVLIQR